MSTQKISKKWVSPEVKRLEAGQAEAVSQFGTPDGGNPGTSRS